ncbi:4-alpha-glucanotransferase [Leptospira idonii]|nr:4-alpha-glucanotransferase [Leptospira idonii]
MLPLSSLLTKQSFECGDIRSLFALGKWAKDAGFSILQILPLNDTGFGRSPYSSISAFAIDPIYISLFELGSNLISRKKTIATKTIHHERIRELKLAELKLIFESDLKKNTEAALKFLSDFPWAYGYCAFRVLYNENEGKDWSLWPEQFQNPDTAKEFVFKEKREEAIFWAYLQLVAFNQLKQAKENLESIGVYLKGDMPILTSRNSADVWEHREYFDLNLQAGAPPDAFSSEGQNWGFPVLNWAELKKTNYRWWQSRLEYLSHFFHLYRIDHVIGMYRIWAIPSSVPSAKLGWFHPQIGSSKEQFAERGLNPSEFCERKLIYEFKKDRYIFYWDFWKNSKYQELPEEIKAKFYPLSEINLKAEEEAWEKAGDEILNAFDGFSDMIPCAEDLGAVPGFIRSSLKRRETLGIDVIRWTRSLENGSYIPQEGYRKTAISVLSTHDTSLALEWWKSLEGDEKKYAESFFFLQKGKELPVTASEILEGLLDFAFSAESLFSIQMLTDLLYQGEFDHLERPELHRINIPGTPEEQNWNYRFSFFAEDLSENKELIFALRKKLIETRRMA